MALLVTDETAHKCWKKLADDVSEGDSVAGRDGLRMQVGCPMRCTFCATGKGGFARNLKAHEIVDQVLTVQERFGTRVSNVGAALHTLSLHRGSLIPTERPASGMEPH